jgi:excinuclease ABC subunit B
MKLSRTTFLFELVQSLYSRTEIDLTRGTFRVKGDTIDINLPYAERGLRVTFWGDEIESLESLELETGKRIESLEAAAIFPANLYVAPKERIHEILGEIDAEMREQERYFLSEGKHIEAQRIRERTTFDLEMIRELGYCSGIENYSRFFDRRVQGTRPFCLLDYFPDDYLMIVDESHATLPQLRGMWGGDRSRKQMLVNYGFRLPSAMDNRPLQFDEFESLVNQVIFVSATPADYELEKTEGVIAEQLVRPTGLLDPPIQVRSSLNQIDDLMEEIRKRTLANERTLVTTLTKRMAEELNSYFQRLNLKCRYIHSEVETLERVEILRGLRLGDFDVLIGVNLLREGLDLPEVSLVAVLDADKEGFLRNMRSLTQTAGRAARNSNGLVIFYADKTTFSMQNTIDETNRRRSIQIAYNEKHNITPRTLSKTREEILAQRSILEIRGEDSSSNYYVEPDANTLAAEPIVAYANRSQIEKMIADTEKRMKAAAKDLDFLTAAQLRDEMLALKKQLNEKFE